MERTAAKIGIGPFDFWKLTPAELTKQVEAYTWRDEQAWRKTAWQTAHLLNIWLKKEDRITVDDLLQKEKPKEPMTDEQMAQNALAWAIALGASDKRKGKGAR
jgi:hypothetical protein